MRDLAFAVVMLLAVPMALARPFAAYLLWGWTGLLVPTAYFFGFMVGVRINLIFALLTLSMIFLQKVRWKDYQGNPMVLLFIVFATHACFSAAFAYPEIPDNARYLGFLVKGLIFCLVMPFFIRERVHFHVFLIVFALGFGIHGVLNGLKTLASGGSHNMLGPGGTMIADRNHLSTALTLTLPILFYLQSYTKKIWVRWCFLGGMSAVIVAILGGGSRAGFIALSVVGFWFFITSRRKGMALLLIVAAASLFLAFAPDHWTDRLSTIKTADEDSSFMGRVIAWKISSAIAVANPIFGGGLHAVQTQYVWDMFKASPGILGMFDIPIPNFSAKAAHSIYFEVMGDLGFVGLGIFLLILVRGLWCRYSIKRTSTALGTEFQWARDMGDMLMLSILAYMVGGASVSLAYLEAIYMILMLIELLRVHVVRAAAESIPTSIGAVRKL